MHLRGKDVTYLLTYPDGREEVLLRVPNYNFEWQLPYIFAEPIKVPAGSTVKAIARYDNSIDEPDEPGAEQRSVLVRAELGRHVPDERALHGGQARTQSRSPTTQGQQQ